MRDYDDMKEDMRRFDALPKRVRDAWNYYGKKAADQVKAGLLVSEIEDEYPKVEANENFGRRRAREAAKAAREERKAGRVAGQISKTPSFRGRKKRRGS